MSSLYSAQLKDYSTQIDHIIRSLIGSNDRIYRARTREEYAIHKAYLNAMLGLMKLVSQRKDATRDLIRRYDQSLRSGWGRRGQAGGLEGMIEMNREEIKRMLDSFEGIARVGLRLPAHTSAKY